MANIIVGVAKYMMILLIALYTYHCFAVFAYADDNMKKRVLHNQRVLMFMIHFMAFAGMYFKTDENKILIFYFAQVIMLGLIMWLYEKFYPKVSRLIVNNMCMLLSIGFIMITRLSYNKAVKQCIIVAGAMLLSYLVPIVIQKTRRLSELKTLYALIGIVALSAVVVVGQVSGGAKLGFE
ncbi:MAG: FtsW/RodA/SpoVE family cell cycle protein, partial [Agathobacter sp.]|nr:FtsW/RodA/SpoVE family cell cycle protein [Agathobacter sp.]